MVYRGAKASGETFTEPEDDYLDAAMCAVCQINEEEDEGDVLVFLTGREEIESLGQLLRRRCGIPEEWRSSSSCCSLGDAEEQMRVFEPSRRAPGRSC